MAAVAAAALTAGGRSALADTPTLAEMDQYVAHMAAQDLEVLKKLKPHQLWVAPDGRPGNTGAKDSPIDLKSACTNNKLVLPGTIVWLVAGNYEMGDLMPKGICGMREKPIIFRALPGARATVIGQLSSNKGCDHIWWWGVEVTGPIGSGVETHDGGEGLKFINLFIHDKHPVQPPAEKRPSAMGVGGWDIGSDHEFYGNIVFRNGWNSLDHGFYSQNSAAHRAKRYVDNLVFENSGIGFQLYGSAPFLRNLYFEGNAAFCTGFVPYAPELAKEPQMNILIGGSRNPLTCAIVRNNCTYHPSLAAKRGVDIGYRGSPNSQILIEHNYFTGGSSAMESRTSPRRPCATTCSGRPAGWYPSPSRLRRSSPRRVWRPPGWSSRTTLTLTTADSASPPCRPQPNPAKPTKSCRATMGVRRRFMFSNASTAMNRTAFIWRSTTGPRGIR